MSARRHFAHSALAPVPSFRSKVLSVVKRIPPGRVATYGDVAAAAGSPRASRAVGNIMRECRSPGIPCHRVIAAGGRLGGFGGNIQLKRELLRAEGILVTSTRVKDFTTRRWPGASGSSSGAARARSKKGLPAGAAKPRRWATRAPDDLV